MSTVSHNTSKETETPLTSDCKVQQQSTGPAFLNSTNSLCFSFPRLVTRVRSHDPAALAVHSNLPDSNSVNLAARGSVVWNSVFLTTVMQPCLGPVRIYLQRRTFSNDISVTSITSHNKGFHRLHWKCNCSCVLSGFRNKPHKFYKKIPPKIMPKILWLCFFVDMTGRQVRQAHLILV